MEYNLKGLSGFRYKFENMVITLIMIAFALICVYPLIYVLAASFSDPTSLTLHEGLLFWPIDFTTKGYQMVLRTNSLLLGYWNTIVIILVGVTVNMCATILTSYVLSKKELYLYKALNLFVIFTMYFGGGMIPTYMVVKYLGMVDSYAALILPGAIGTWNMIILRTAIGGVPESLLDAAKIDGASEFYVLLKVVVPLVKPTLAVLTLYYMVGHWNSWFGAMIYLRSRDKYPLQLILREVLILGSNLMSEAITDMASLTSLDLYRSLTKYCSIIISTVPILCVYPFLQKYFVKGVLVGSLKG